jgi:hypothetical protein
LGVDESYRKKRWLASLATIASLGCASHSLLLIHAACVDELFALLAPRLDSLSPYRPLALV